MDSRLATQIFTSLLIARFWGIVWTAGKGVKNLQQYLRNRFWGIVWTAGLFDFDCDAQGYQVFGG